MLRTILRSRLGISRHQPSALAHPAIRRAVVEVLETRRLLASVPITNADFENPILSDGQSSAGVPGWTFSVAAGYAGAATVWRPLATETNVARISTDVPYHPSGPSSRLSQILTTNFQGETTYLLQARVGMPADLIWENPVVEVQLLAGGEVLARGGFNFVHGEDNGIQYDFSTSYTSPANHAKIGQPLELRLHGWDGGGTIDNVQLNATPLNPPSPTVNLAVAGIPDADEETVGEWVPINSNFDEENFGSDGRPRHDNEPDASGHRIDPGDQELRDVALTFGGNGTSGTWKLDFPSQIKVWKNTGGAWTQITSGATQPSITAPATVNLKVEGILLSASRNNIELKATFTPVGGSAVIDRARFTVAGVDIDIDSDNNNGFDPPDSDGDEGLLEGDGTRPGKFLNVNDNDSDNDGILDFADGFNLDGIPGNADDATAGEQFVPVLLQFPEPLDVSVATLRLIYSGSSPDEMDGLTPGEGHLRLWKKNGNVARDGNSIWGGGDYVPEGDFNPSQVGITNNDEAFLYIEAVRGSEAISSRVIQLLGDPDGPGPAPFELFDAVIVTATGDAGEIPATPSNVQAGVASTTQVNLDWNDIAGERRLRNPPQHSRRFHAHRRHADQ